MSRPHMANAHAPMDAQDVRQAYTAAVTTSLGTDAAAWRHTLQWLLLSGMPLALTLLMKPMLTQFWHSVMTLWTARMGWPWLVHAIPANTGNAWLAQGDGTVSPSSLTLGLTWFALMLMWVMTSLFSDRFHPLKIMLRALCLIQAAACVFFMLAPASFPYTVTRHTAALLDMGYSLMLAVGPMLALGFGILKQALLPKILAPLGVLAYFALMLPHKVLLHAWILEKGSILFMPVLFMCFGTLLDMWIFIALYAWLCSRIPVASGPNTAGAVT